MEDTYVPATHELRALFAEEIVALGGRVCDVLDDQRCLFARAVLPGVAEVEHDDRINGGVAIRAFDAGIAVLPYTFRQVCANGAIMAHTIDVRQLARVAAPAPASIVADTLWDVRMLIRACAAPEVFAAAMREMREATRAPVELDEALQMLPLLRRMPAHMRGLVMREIALRFEREGGRTAFQLMNAVTSLARDTQDPAQRWHLEELGGGVPALLVPRPRYAPPAAVAVSA